MPIGIHPTYQSPSHPTEQCPCYGPYKKPGSINAVRAVLILTGGEGSINAARSILILTGESVSINPRPAGVWLVTRPAGGPKGPPEISQTTGPISKFQTLCDSPVRELPVKGKKLNRRSLMTSQVRSKSEFSTFRAWWHRRVKFRC